NANLHILPEITFTFLSTWNGATEDKIKCIENYGIVIYEGIYVVDILTHTQLSIPEIKNDFYMIKELIKKDLFLQDMDYANF
ncbi:575_t:CDS:2, partial [Entrophospora sp. SA101]